MFKTIVVPTDGSDHARKAVSVAVDLAEKYGARVIAVHVMPPIDAGSLPDELKRFAQNEIPGGTNRQVLEAIGEQILQEARSQSEGETAPDVETRLETGDPAAAILETAESEKADLIVMGSRGLSHLKGLLMGSVSHKVSQLSPCSCITVK